MKALQMQMPTHAGRAQQPEKPAAEILGERETLPTPNKAATNLIQPVVFLILSFLFFF